MVWITLSVVAALFLLFWRLTFYPVRGRMLAVAQAAYLECVRQPMFWFLLLFTLFFMFVGVFLPFFTFRELDDLKMMKSLTLDAIMVATLVLAVFTASYYIAEEIEGRTAITLLSKPMSRFQFLMGKFLGILMGTLALTLILSIFMGFCILYRTGMDIKDKIPDPPEVKAMQDTLAFLPSAILELLRYIVLVFSEINAMAPGIVLNFFQVMILTAVSVALATRLPMVVNLIVCAILFFVGRLTHILEAKSAGNELVQFVARVFATVLPGFNYFDVGPAIVSDIEVPWVDYVAQAGLHALLYSAIALLLGLILFEDRDLA